MSMESLLSRPASWLGDADRTGTVISSRVRLARNVAGTAFPGWAGDEEVLRLSRRLKAALLALPAFAGVDALDMSELTPLDKLVLRERHLISTELAERGAGSAVILSPDERLAVMVNEEDHIRIQGMGPGLDLESLWMAVDGLDTMLDQCLPFAFSPALGYLTACPSNVGTGLRASVMLHLPGLKLMNEVEAVVRGLSKIGLAVRGLLGEGTEASGTMYQVSNQVTLGEAEGTIIRRLREVVDEVREHEAHARARLLETRRRLLFDRIGRAFGLLTHASLISSDEALDLLSAIRLGVVLELVRELSVAEINELFLLVQPAHLQRRSGRMLSQDERDEARAALVKQSVSKASLVLG